MSYCSGAGIELGILCAQPRLRHEHHAHHLVRGACRSVVLHHAPVTLHGVHGLPTPTTCNNAIGYLFAVGVGLLMLLALRRQELDDFIYLLSVSYREVCVHATYTSTECRQADECLLTIGP